MKTIATNTKIQVSKISQNSQAIPLDPGIYIYYNKTGEIIYIGKAKCLRSRVSSYFASIVDGPKTAKLVSEITHVKFIIVQNEIEAFLLEDQLIKKHQPKYNHSQKDDKSKLYLVIKRLKHNDTIIPSISTIRKTDKIDVSKSELFGPYTETKTANNAIRLIRKAFPFRNCGISKYNTYKRMKRSCIYGQISLCPAPCISEDGIIVNKQNVANVKKLLKHGYNAYITQLEQKMKRLGKSETFEEALEIRNQIDTLKELFNYSILPSEYEDNPNLIEDIAQNRVEAIKNLFNLETSQNFRIECYDISNIMGDWATGSMVVSENGKVNKDEYRRFRIKFTSGITDFGMMAEIFNRRIHRDWTIPNLIMVDGGKGQVSAVLKLFKPSRQWQKIPIIGIFKPHDQFVMHNSQTSNLQTTNSHQGGHSKLHSKDRETRHFCRKDGDWYIISPSNRDTGYQHLRALRDEAHRFAKGYHKKLRTSKYNS